LNQKYKLKRFNMAGYDLTFNGSGRVVADLGGIDRVSELGTAADGKLLALSYAIAPGVATITRYNPAIITRYNPDGSLDTSFATAGKLNTGLAGYALTSPDGKIIVYGVGLDGRAIIRYLANGQIDTSFATAGKYSISNPSEINSFIQLRTNQTNGSSEIILNQTLGELTLDLASGQTIVNTNQITNTSTLLDVNGQIKSFPISGVAAASPLSINLSVLNGIVASPTTNLADPNVQQLVNLLGEPLLAQLRAKFSTNGFRIYDVAAGAAGAQSDGSILLNFQGYTSPGSYAPAVAAPYLLTNLNVLSRITSTGTFDPSFGVNGLLTSPFFVDGTTFTTGNAKFDITNGAYTAIYNFGTQDISVYRYTKNGQVDTTFGGNGKFTLPSDLLPQVTNPLFPFPTISVVVDSQNRALVSIKNTNDSFINVVRVNSNGTIDNTFGSNGKIQLQSRAGDRINPVAVVLNADDRLSFGGAINDDILIAKYDISGVSSTILTSSILNRTDFNNDGKSDILWRNDFGSVALWQMNGATVTSGSLTSFPNLDPSWKAASTGDFNGDGRSDILWRNTNGSIAVWAMGGSTVKSSSLTSTPSLDNSWTTAGTGDYNGDGKSDILWRNTSGAVAVWEMDGATVTSSALTSTPALDNSWKVAGNSDFNGDGKSDILWRNDDGSVALWQMNGAAITASTAVAKVATDWKIAGTGDFNGDGKADILWRNDDGRVAALWQMNGAAITSSSLTSTPSRDSSQTVAGIGDYNGDGKADILWRKDTGALEVWQMNGSTVVSSTLTSITADGSFWKIAAPII
jgi:uncharacterized delta-60 repeat protein